MSSTNKVCDFCGTNTRILETELEVEFYLNDEVKTKFWCGLCGDGSTVYFQDLDSSTMVELIEASDEVLREFMDKPDIPHNRVKRKWIDDEVTRAKRELVFRVLNADDDV